MTQLIDIRRVEVGPRFLTARVRVAMGAPLMTSEDLEGTTRVYRLLPHIVEHVCLGDGGETFRDVMGDTEVAHLLEHVTVELLAQTDVAGDVTVGRTHEVEGELRTYDIEFPCPDDALVVGALSSAVWILQWAYTGGAEPEPNIDATVRGLVDLVDSLLDPEPNPGITDEYVVEGDEARAILEELGMIEVPGAGGHPLEGPPTLHAPEEGEGSAEPDLDPAEGTPLDVPAKDGGESE